jgi:hypothetical protein
VFLKVSVLMGDPAKSGNGSIVGVGGQVSNEKFGEGLTWGVAGRGVNFFFALPGDIWQ